MVWKNGCLLSYQLPDQIVDWVKNKPLQYFIQMGHGAKASPEIYSGGPGFLISAGGVYQGKRSLIVARPITLLIGDDAQNLNEVSRTNSNQKVLYNKFQFSGGKTDSLYHQQIFELLKMLAPFSLSIIPSATGLQRENKNASFTNLSTLIFGP